MTTSLAHFWWWKCKTPWWKR